MVPINNGIKRPFIVTKVAQTLMNPKFLTFINRNWIFINTFARLRFVLLYQIVLINLSYEETAATVSNIEIKFKTL